LENKYYVYRHYKKGTLDVFYIGMSGAKKYERAFTYHHPMRTPAWLSTFNEYGRDVEILAEDLDKETAAELEEFLISIYGRTQNNTGCLVNNGKGGLNNTDMIRSEEWNAKLSESKKGTSLGEDNPYGKKHTEEIRKKMQKPHPSVQGKGHFRSKKIIDVSTGVIYDCIREAAENLGYVYSTLKCNINGTSRNKTTLIYLTNYLDQKLM